MDEIFVSIITTLGINGVFLILYLRLWAKFDALEDRYMNFLEGRVRAQDIIEASHDDTRHNPVQFTRP